MPGYEAICCLGTRLSVAWVRGYLLPGYEAICCLGTRLSVAWVRDYLLPGYEAICCLGTRLSVAWVRGYSPANGNRLSIIKEDISLSLSTAVQGHQEGVVVQPTSSCSETWLLKGDDGTSTNMHLYNQCTIYPYQYFAWAHQRHRQCCICHTVPEGSTFDACDTLPLRTISY